jgi:hypothetical protein
MNKFSWHRFVLVAVMSRENRIEIESGAGKNDFEQKAKQKFTTFLCPHATHKL